jgi:hypothetical protein
LVGMDEPFLSFWCCFNWLDEMTSYHDYHDALYKIYWMDLKQL